MRHFTLILTTAVVAALMAAGCQEKPDGGDGSVSLHSDAEIALPAAEADTVISFTATADWTAAVEDGEWLSVSPASGKAGEISATLSATANNEADARTATVRITCGTDEATVTVTQEGAAGEEPEEPEEPEQPTGKMPKSISMVLDEIGTIYHHDYTFGYDEEGRVVSMLFKTDNENFGWPENDYKFEYGQNTVDINIEFRSDELSGLSIAEWTLDSEGRVIKESMTQSFEGETSGPYVTNLIYNSDGYLEKTESEDTYPWYLTWKNGDIFSIEADRNAPGEEMENFPVFLTEEENTGYFDYNWLWSEMYMINPYGYGAQQGLMDMAGRRGTHLTKPTFQMTESSWSPDGTDQSWFERDENGYDPYDKEYFTENEIGTTLEHLFSTAECSFDDIVCSFDYDEEGDLLKVVSEMPVTWIQYIETYKVIPHNPGSPDDVIDGENIYYRENVQIIEEKAVATGKTTQDKQTMTITFTY